MLGVWIALGVLVLLVVWFVGIYNGLVRARNETKNAWSQIDVQLKRRHDLIPNLVETAKGYMQHERQTLEAVIQARNMAVQARGPKQAGVAEGALGSALTGFFGLAENYPDLKANQNFLALQEELTATENKVGFARQAYNDAATRYNNQRETFPNSLVAGGFEQAEMFEIQDAAERAVPKVEF
ncbi:MAG: LemA family protein [Planctomycetes bacterium]|nr:LemA family protein [Planctomycetota bacterium]